MNCRSNGLCYFLDVEGVDLLIGMEYGFKLVAHARQRNPRNCGVDFFRAMIDETSGACRSSEELWLFTTRRATETVEAMRRRKAWWF